MTRLSVSRSARSPHSDCVPYGSGQVLARRSAGGAASQPVHLTPSRSYLPNSHPLLATPLTPHLHHSPPLHAHS